MENSPIIPNIRLRKIILTDFRNIEYSEIEIPGGKLSDYLEGNSSILGLYGQNGSGKTSLLMALNALKCAMTGSSFLYPMFKSAIRSGCDRTGASNHIYGQHDAIGKGCLYSWLIKIENCGSICCLVS